LYALFNAEDDAATGFRVCVAADFVRSITSQSSSESSLSSKTIGLREVEAEVMVEKLEEDVEEEEREGAFECGIIATGFEFVILPLLSLDDDPVKSIAVRATDDMGLKLSSLFDCDGLGPFNPDFRLPVRSTNGPPIELDNEALLSDKCGLDPQIDGEELLKLKDDEPTLPPGLAKIDADVDDITIKSSSSSTSIGSPLVTNCAISSNSSATSS
jgi:hypothetical protein